METEGAGARHTRQRTCTQQGSDGSDSVLLVAFCVAWSCRLTPRSPADGAIDVAKCPAHTDFATLKAALRVHWAGGRAASTQESVRLVTLSCWLLLRQALGGEAEEGVQQQVQQQQGRQQEAQLEDKDSAQWSEVLAAAAGSRALDGREQLITRPPGDYSRASSAYSAGYSPASSGRSSGSAATSPSPSESGSDSVPYTSREPSEAGGSTSPTPCPEWNGVDGSAAADGSPQPTAAGGSIAELSSAVSEISVDSELPGHEQHCTAPPSAAAASPATPARAAAEEPRGVAAAAEAAAMPNGDSPATAAAGDAVEAATALAQQLSSMGAAAAAAAAAVSAGGPLNPDALHSSLAAAQQLMAALAPAAHACSALLANAAAAAAAQAEAGPATSATAEAAVQTESVTALRMCGHCGACPEELAAGQKLQRCPCTTVYYCSAECQVRGRAFTWLAVLLARGIHSACIATQAWLV